MITPLPTRVVGSTVLMRLTEETTMIIHRCRGVAIFPRCWEDGDVACTELFFDMGGVWAELSIFSPLDHVDEVAEVLSRLATTSLEHRPPVAISLDTRHRILRASLGPTLLGGTSLYLNDKRELNLYFPE